MRPGLLVGSVLAATIGGTYTARANVGPDFSCGIVTSATDPLVVLECSNPSLARAELGMVQSYYVIREIVGPSGWAAEKAAFLGFLQIMRHDCGIPDPNEAQSKYTPASAAACAETEYEHKKTTWLSTFSGAALEEAQRQPEDFIVIQQRLVDLGFLPNGSTVDGIFGTETRDAIMNWQRSVGHPITGFVSNDDVAVLLPTGAQSSSPVQSPASAPPVDPFSTAAPSQPAAPVVAAPPPPPSDCKAITDAQARLACYDAAPAQSRIHFDKSTRQIGDWTVDIDDDNFSNENKIFVYKVENESTIALRCFSGVPSFAFGVGDESVSAGDEISVKIRIDSGLIHVISGAGVLSKADGHSLIYSPMVDGLIQEIIDGDTLHARILDVTTGISVDKSFSLDGIESTLKEFRKLCPQ